MTHRKLRAKYTVVKDRSLRINNSDNNNKPIRHYIIDISCRCNACVSFSDMDHTYKTISYKIL